MTNPSNPAERVGWEPIWHSGDIPSRYQSFAAPDVAVVEWADLLPAGGLVLDVGCGAGRHCVYLGGRGMRVAGLDVSATGIMLAQAACAERQIAFDGRVSDMSMIPWPDATFDAALSTASIHHHLRADMARTIGEVWRVLKPSGLFLVDFPCTDALDYQMMRILVTAGVIEEVEPNTFIDKRPVSEDIDGYLPHHYCDEADVRDLLRPFDVIKLWAALRAAQPEWALGPGLVGKWVAWGRKADSCES
jgi:SAM-dependent methyltransferase